MTDPRIWQAQIDEVKEAVQALPSERATRARTFELPPAVADHLTPADRTWLWLPPHPLSAHDELNARDQLDAWDALAGRLLRGALFGDGGRGLRKGAEAVAAVAEDLHVYLDGPRP